MELWVIRHARTGWNEEGRLQGRTDCALSERGRAEARAWNFHARETFAQVWASPLRRARETAAILGAAAPRVHEGLAEQALGAWEGRTRAEVKVSLGPELVTQDWLGLDHRAPGGESLREVMVRLQTWLAEVPRGPGRSLVVSHKGTMQALFALATGADFLAKPRPRPRFPFLHRYDWSEEGLRLLAVNEPLVRP